MNDLMRPALYDAWHDIVPVARARRPPRPSTTSSAPCARAATSSARTARWRCAEGDLLAVMSAGAYGMSMSSNYNTRPRAAEVLVDGATPHLVRRRERIEDLFGTESVPFQP